MRRLFKSVASHLSRRRIHAKFAGLVVDEDPPTVAVPPPPPPPPTPNSPQSLYRNLLFLTSNHPPSIDQAIDHFFASPKPLHSTKSFNLLISLALHSASFASVGRLFTAMRAESVPPNMETHKLHVRWFVRTGNWNDAWKRALEIAANHNNLVPLPLWLELFGSQKRGALRHWVITDPEPSAKPPFGPAPLARKRLVPRSSHTPRAVQQSRYNALMPVSPLLTSSDQIQILPRTVLIITRMMYKLGRRNLALSTALSYLQSLPPQLRRCDRRRILDLVHFHLSVVARRSKPCLKQHFIQRRILRKFLLARPDLAPRSTTLFLLLAPLRGCRKSGTLAMQCLHLFQKRWGPRVQSRLVRRRVANLALKEGRLDIVAAMIKLERCCAALDHPFPRTICASTRRPWRTLFSRRGAENQRWRLVEDKYRRRLMSKSCATILPPLGT